MIENSFKIPIELTIPEIDKITSKLGIPENTDPDKKTLECIDSAIKIYQSLAKPRGLFKNLSINEFEVIFQGENLNEPDAPLEIIYKESDHLALFVVTIGIEVCKKISNLFEINDFAIASILDVVASAAVELAEKELIYKYLNIKENNKLDSTQFILPFSPGYCGWHITSQRKLFQHLKPEKIGVSINESCLMNPLKSISGVFVTGDKKIFEIYPDYTFCKDCKSQSCIERTSKILNS
jgi:hypothetical protein